VILRGEVLEVRNIDGSLHIARKHRPSTMPEPAFIR
jgi:hypothetical protein